MNNLKWACVCRTKKAKVDFLFHLSFLFLTILLKHYRFVVDFLIFAGFEYENKNNHAIIVISVMYY